ncbi:MAG: ABC transporter permease [Phycisphaerae bacterium]
MMMPATLRLAISTLWRKPIKPLLTALVITAAVALVMTACCMLASMKASLRHNLTMALGHVDARITPLVTSTGAALPAGTLPRAQHCSMVEYAAGEAMTFGRIRVGDMVHPAHLIAGSFPATQKLLPAVFSAGGPLTRQDGQIVLNDTLAHWLDARVGMTVTLLGARGRQKLVVMGLVKRSSVQRYLTLPSAFITQQTLRHIDGHPVRWERINIKFKPGTDHKTDLLRLRRAMGPGVKIRSMGGGRKPFRPLGQVLSRLRWLVAIPTALGAGLLILAIFAVGFQERVRYFGQMRCLGAARRQVALIALYDSALPMALGLAGGLAVGLLAAWLLIHRVHHGHLKLQPGWSSFFIAGGAGLLAAGIGLALPVWRAWRATPLAAVRNIAMVRGHQSLRPALWVGFAALVLQIMLWQIPNPLWAVWIYILLGAPLLLIAAAALAPVAVSWCDQLLKRPLAWLWHIEPMLFSTKVSPYRAGIMAAALLAGISFFVSMRARGIGLLESWEFPAQFPDAFVFSPFTPLSRKRVAALQSHVSGVTGVSALTAFGISAQLESGPVRKLLFVAVQPQSFLTMLGVTFTQGNRAQALAELHSGQGVLVAKNSLKSLKLTLGRTVKVATLSGVRRLTVVGVITSPGVNIAQSFLRVRHAFHHAAVGAVIGTLPEARQYFGSNGPNLVMLTLAPHIHGMPVVEKVKSFLASGGQESVLGRLLNFQQLTLRGMSVRHMKRNLDAIIRRVMRQLTLAAFGGMLLAATAVAAMTAAAIRQRRYEFGVLRAVGASRWQLLRIVFAELTLIVTAASILGCLLGQYLALMATLVDHRLAGFDSRYVLAWPDMGIAALTTAIVTLAAGFIPAWRAAIVGVRSLLAPGRE